MAVRLLEMHRILKPTGSIYLHCDDTAGHYLKLLMDGIFGAKRFQNAITWRRAISHNDAGRYGRISDCILFYTASDEYTWNDIRDEQDDEMLEKSYPRIDEDGKRFRSDNLTGPKHGAGGGESVMEWLRCSVSQSGLVSPEDRHLCHVYRETLDTGLQGHQGRPCAARCSGRRRADLASVARLLAGTETLCRSGRREAATGHHLHADRLDQLFGRGTDQLFDAEANCAP